MGKTEAETFVQDWERAWRERDGQAYADLLHDGCVLENPWSPVTRDELPAFVDAMLATMPDHRIAAVRWGETSDGVIIEWHLTATLPGGPIDLRGADRFTLRDGKAVDGVAYCDPRQFNELQAVAG